MMLSSDEEKGEDMGIEESTLNGWAYKENQLYHQAKSKERGRTKNPQEEKPQINTPYP